MTKKLQEDIVNWHPSKKKCPCKNRGEHEWGKPTLLYDTPEIRYEYKLDDGRVLLTSEPYKEHKLLKAEVNIFLETRCIHCGKKVTSFLRSKLTN